MPIVVGVSFKKAGKVYYFNPNSLDLKEGDAVIAETSRGIEFGEIMIEPREVPDEEIVPPLRKVVRKATDSDIRKEESNCNREKNAYAACQRKIQDHDLPMKLIDAEYCFDGSQVTFYFSADSRVDFRELVKDLASTLRTKVQLHQVGVRDEAKLFGGMGPCGRALCCSSFLSDFEPVSMKMAKEQSLFLNPLKFSGICGKLMCCLKYEYPMYREMKSNFPTIGAVVTTPEGQGKVVETNVMKRTLAVELEDGNVAQFAVESLEGWNSCPRQCDACPNAEAESEAQPELDSHDEVEES